MDKSTKKVVYIDMDGVLVDFSKAIEIAFENNPGFKEKHKNEPDLIPNIFKDPPPIEGAITAVNILAESGKYDMFIATTASWENKEASMHKIAWIKKYFGDLFKKKMVITHRKDQLIGDYLIDDREANGAFNFKGELLQFGWSYEKQEWNKYREWSDIINKLI